LPCTETTYDGYFDGNNSRGALNYDFFHHIFLFASPHTTNYNKFVKEDCFKVYLNPWSKEDCRKLVKIINFEDEEEWQWRFNLIGGKLRFLFPWSIQCKALHDLVKEGTPSTLDKLKEQVQLACGAKHI